MSDGVVEQLKVSVEKLGPVLEQMRTTYAALTKCIQSLMILKSYNATCIKNRKAIHDGLLEAHIRALSPHDLTMLCIALTQGLPLKPTGAEASKATTMLLGVKPPLQKAGNVLDQVCYVLLFYFASTHVLTHACARPPAPPLRSLSPLPLFSMQVRHELMSFLEVHACVVEENKRLRSIVTPPHGEGGARASFAPDAPPPRGVALDLVANADRLRVLGVDARRGMMIEGLANLEAGAFELSDESSSSDDEAARDAADEAARDEAAHDVDVAVVEDLVVLEAEDRASVKRSRVTRSSSRG